MVQVLEVDNISSGIYLILRFEKGLLAQNGQILQNSDCKLKIIGVAMRKGFLNSKYQESFMEENLWECKVTLIDCSGSELFVGQSFDIISNS